MPEKITVILDDDESEKLHRLADRDTKGKISEIVRRALREYANRYLRN